MLEKEMTREDLIRGLRRALEETGSLLCLGCGHEHGCGHHGCVILRQAADMLKRDAELLEELTAFRARLQALEKGLASGQLVRRPAGDLRNITPAVGMGKTGNRPG